MLHVNAQHSRHAWKERSARKSNFYLNYIYLLKSLLSIKLENAEEAVEQAEETRQECITSPGIPQLAACL